MIVLVLPFWGIQCDACYRACPLLGKKAITVEYTKMKEQEKHAF